MEPPGNQPSLEMISNILWQVWKERNNYIFRGTKPDAWTAPVAGSLKINVDGSIREGSTEGAVAGVVRDFSGSLVDGFAKQVRAVSSLHIETLAVLEAWETRASWTKCLELLQQLPNVDLHYCPRAANTAADWAARQKRSKSLPCNWTFSPPQGLWAILCNDASIVGLRPAII